MPQLEPGRTLGQWTTEAFLDEGGNGEVWQVSGPGHSKAALKLLKKNSAQSVAYQRFRMEIQALRTLTSVPGILPILDANLPEQPRKANRAWYVMPFATSLASRLEGTDVAEAVSAVALVAETLALIHAQGIRHRDIKPANLLWFADRPQVADFGLVSLPDHTSVQESDRVPGSWGYMSDEMLANPATADAAAADVFALAKVLWMVLVPTNRYPPQGPLRADNGPSSLARNLLLPTAATLDRTIEAATRPEPARISMNRFASELRGWLALPAAPAAPAGLAEKLAAARTAMAGTVGERDAAAVRERALLAAQQTLVALAAPLLDAIAAIDSGGAVLGSQALLPKLRRVIEERDGLGVRSFGRAFHHGIRITRSAAFRSDEHLLIAFALQVDDEGVGTVAGCGFVGDIDGVNGGQEFLLFQRQEAPLGAAFETALNRVVREASQDAERLVELFAAGR